MAKARKTIHDKAYQVLVGRLRAVRQSAKVTQAELAGRLGVDQSYVSKYERAERRVNVMEVRAICEALGLNLTRFIASFETALKRKGAP